MVCRPKSLFCSPVASAFHLTDARGGWTKDVVWRKFTPRCSFPSVHNVCAHFKRTGLNESWINIVDPFVGCWHRSRFLTLMTNYAEGDQFGVQMLLCSREDASQQTWVGAPLIEWKRPGNGGTSMKKLIIFDFILNNTQQQKMACISRRWLIKNYIFLQCKKKGNIFTLPCPAVPPASHLSNGLISCLHNIKVVSFKSTFNMCLKSHWSVKISHSSADSFQLLIQRSSSFQTWTLPVLKFTWEEAFMELQYANTSQLQATWMFNAQKLVCEIKHESTEEQMMKTDRNWRTGGADLHQHQDIILPKNNKYFPCEWGIFNTSGLICFSHLIKVLVLKDGCFFQTWYKIILLMGQFLHEILWISVYLCYTI